MGLWSPFTTASDRLITGFDKCIIGPPGYLAIGFAAKPTAPKLPLLVLLVASEALDLLSFGFAVIGIEKLGISQTNLEQGL
jgi:hypothetical protein